MRNIIIKAQWYTVALLGCLAVVVWFFVWQSSAVSRDTSPVRVVIPAGSSAGKIAAALHEKGLIRNILIFRLTARIGGKEDQLKPGAYDFSPSMSVFRVIHKIAAGDIAAKWVTIPEGYTIQQIGDRLQSAGIIADGSAFTAEASSSGQSFKRMAPVSGNNLEGYLFPDTYLFAPSSTSSQVIEAILTNFRRKVVTPLDTQLAGSASQWHDILTIASMIEREAKKAGERPVISAVIWNRLRKGMKLEIDATVLYALGQHKSRVTYADLRIPSPYNTYYVSGLPAGPIGNPGLDAIKAALHPAKVDYLFYVAKGDGSHIFSRTLSEHNRAKAMTRSGR